MVRALGIIVNTPDPMKIREILDRAADLPPDQRPALLERVCGDDAELRAEVESLLAALSRDEHFLIDPTIEPPLTPVEMPGSRIGPYKLLEQIGEGGMGIVFMAEQEQPVRRRVALKIIKPGMDSRQVIARFEAERQALAVMDHPNIAHVYDAGATDTGRPYFVMELVRGTPVTDYCDQHQLTTAERLELVVQVCQAVQHAHGKGIIHRDLKPSNVLVTVADGRPVPKVIDFGVAKATQSRLTEKTLFTEFRQLIGTPQYMSPEQAESNGIDIDTRSDVYSLGVLLYELLTGTTPLDGRELRSKAYADVERLIRESEPPKPSTRLSTLGDAATAIAASRKTQPEKLGQQLRGELDWIVMRALEKDRSRRYETANGLARDIQRHLADEPVEACPPSTSYRLHKFIRKNRAPLTVTAGFVLVLVVATIVSSWQAVRATRATSREAAQRRQAEAVANLLESVFRGLDPTGPRRSGEDLKKQLALQLDRAALQLNSPIYSGDPATRARLRSALGTTELGLGEAAKGEALLRAALIEEGSYASPDDLQTLITMNALALAWDEAGRYQAAIALFEQVRDRSLPSLGANHRSTLNTTDCLAVAYNHAGRYQDALALSQRVLERKTKTLGADDRDTLIAMSNLGSAYLSAGRFDEAIKTFEAARQRAIKTLGDNEDLTLTATNNLIVAYTDACRSSEAIELGERLRGQETRILGAEHPSTVTTLNNLGSAYMDAGRAGAAVALLEQVRPVCLRIFGPDHRQTLNALNNLAEAYRLSERFDEAIQLYQQVRQQQLRTLGPDHPDYFEASYNLAAAYTHTGKTVQAIELLEQVRDGRVRKLGIDHPNTLRTLKVLANLYQQQALYAKARPIWLDLSNWSLTHPQAMSEFRPSQIVPHLIDCCRALGDSSGADLWTGKLASLGNRAGQNAK